MAQLTAAPSGFPFRASLDSSASPIGGTASQDNVKMRLASAAAMRFIFGAFVTLHSRLDRGSALQTRKLTNGAVQLYWRYSLGGETSREPIGVYDQSAPPKKFAAHLTGRSASRFGSAKPTPEAPVLPGAAEVAWGRQAPALTSAALNGVSSIA